MKACFSEISEFLDELGKEETKIVRITAKEKSINNGTSELFLLSGFTVGENLNELNQYCGETYVGDESNEMIEQYKAFENEIQEFCEAHDIEVRGGEYDG